MLIRRQTLTSTNDRGRTSKDSGHGIASWQSPTERHGVDRSAPVAGSLTLQGLGLLHTGDTFRPDEILRRVANAADANAADRVSTIEDGQKSAPPSTDKGLRVSCGRFEFFRCCPSLCKCNTTHIVQTVQAANKQERYFSALAATVGTFVHEQHECRPRW